MQGDGGAAQVADKGVVGDGAHFLEIAVGLEDISSGGPLGGDERGALVGGKFLEFLDRVAVADQACDIGPRAAHFFHQVAVRPGDEFRGEQLLVVGAVAERLGGAGQLDALVEMVPDDLLHVGVQPVAHALEVGGEVFLGRFDQRFVQRGALAAEELVVHLGAEIGGAGAAAGLDGEQDGIEIAAEVDHGAQPGARPRPVLRGLRGG